MAEAILMPKSGISVESCLIGAWKKDVGDRVEIGDILFDYETDKAQFECESTASGILLEKFYEEGAEVEVMKPVCAVGQSGEDVSALCDVSGAGNTAASATGENTGYTAAAATGANTENTAAAGSGANSADANADLASKPAATASDVGTIPSSASASPGSKTSPRARGFAEKAGVDLGSVIPSGPNGRIVEQDVRDAMATERTSAPAAEAAASALAPAVESTAPAPAPAVESTAPAPAPAFESTAPAPAPAFESTVPVAGSVALAPASADGAAYTDEKFTKIRQVISTSMLGSLREMAQLTHHHSFDAGNVLSLRRDFKAAADERLTKISIGDMILFAVSRVLKDHPDVNSHLLEGNILRKFNAVHLGVAIDTPRGLIVPTIFHADHKSLAQISAELKALAETARAGNISPDCLTGATFTVSNLGPTGVEVFTPIINPPQVAILGVCGSVAKIRMDADGAKPYSSIGLSLTYDHRAIDGAPASRFAQDLCRKLEDISTLLAL